jgi:hypothetical protein
MVGFSYQMITQQPDGRDGAVHMVKQCFTIRDYSSLAPEAQNAAELGFGRL